MDPLALRLSVVGVFNNCLEVFRLVQRGRRFGEEYEDRLAKFDIAKYRLRLLSWGNQVAITQGTLPNFEYGIEPVFKALSQLEQLLGKVQKCLEKYDKLHAPEEPFGSFEEWNKSQKDQTQQRGKQTTIIQRAKFVLDDAETLDKLFVKIDDFLKFLESDERHRRDISVDHASHDGQRRYSSYRGQVYSPSEGLSADGAHGRRISAPGDAISQIAMRSDSATQRASSGPLRPLRDSFNWGASCASSATPFNEPSRTLSLPELLSFEDEDTSMVWRELGFNNREQTEYSPMSPQLSNVEFDTQPCTTAEIADTSISDFIALAPLGRVWRHNSFPMFNQRKNSTLRPSLASISPDTVEGFSSRSLKPNLDGRKCLAFALDRSQLAILASLDTGSEVCLFDTNQSPLPGQQLEVLGQHPLQRGTWTGVAIAGSYLAAWGEKVLHLAVRSNSPGAVKYDVCFAESAPTFDTSQKAALSRNGVLAMTNGQKIELRFASHPNTPVLLQCPIEVTTSIDIAFNEEGDNLYYWARALNAYLFSWQLKEVRNNQSPVSAAQYKCGEKIDEATLFPYSRQRGCIIGYSARTICFPAVVSGKHLIKKPVKRKCSEELKRKQVQGACVLGDSSLIAIQGPSSRFNNELAVCEYPLQGHGINASIGNGKKLGRLSMRFRKKDEAMLYSVSAFRDQDERTLHVIVCSPDADVDVVTVKGNG